MTPNDPITDAPIIMGGAGKAWSVDLLPGRTPVLGVWLIEADWAHPFWHSYVLCLIHLRGAPGYAPAVKIAEGVTHEVALFALDPRGSRDEMLRTFKFMNLTPANFIGQFARRTDAEAMETAETAVRHVCAGILSPDSDFRSLWEARFR